MRRWLIYVVGLPLYLLVLMLVGTLALAFIAVVGTQDLNIPDAVDLIGECLSEPAWWAYAGIAAIIVTALQVVFLLPIFSRRPPRDQRGRSLTLSLLIGGMIAGVLTMGLGTAVIDLVAVLRPDEIQLDDKGALWLVPLFMLIAGWIVWSAVLLVFSRGIWADRTLGRVAGLLLAGTLVETIVVIPLDVMVRRRTDCYCTTGTFVTLVIAAVATLWVAGPGIVIALTARRFREWRTRYCPRCGYPKHASPGPRCPECGTPW